MVLPEYFDCYRNDVTIHELDGFRQGVGAHYAHEGFLVPDEEKKEKTYRLVENEIRTILDSEDDIFLWVHFPHVINGEVAYGSDIELFDKFVGLIRTIVPDECIALTADHGNMNGHKGKICYGYDVYQPAIRIPLIVPRIDELREYMGNSTSTDLFTILFEKKIPKHKFVYSDSAFCGQEHRKLAIIYDHFKYIYNKKTGIEELYDIEYDPGEEFSLMEDYVYDIDRKFNAPSRELYYYPNWGELDRIREIMRQEKKRIWKNGSKRTEIKSKIKDCIRPLYAKLRKKKSSAKTIS